MNGFQHGNQLGLKHGYSKTDTYRKWISMKSRCSDSSRGKCRQNYFLRGIRVCSRWQSFENFLEDMGLCPRRYTLERKNNDGHYEPGNCVWAPRAVNQANKRNSINVEFAGRRQTLNQWASEIGVQYQLLRYRICIAGWPVEKALSTSPHRKTL